MDINYTSTSNKSLTFFVGTQMLNMLGLATDYILIQTNKPPITSICTKYPVVGVIVCGIQLIIPVSLSLHFLSSRNNNYDYLNIP